MSSIAMKQWQGRGCWQNHLFRVNLRTVICLATCKRSIFDRKEKKKERIEKKMYKTVSFSLHPNIKCGNSFILFSYMSYFFVRFFFRPLFTFFLEKIKHGLKQRFYILKVFFSVLRIMSCSLQVMKARELMFLQVFCVCMHLYM